MNTTTGKTPEYKIFHFGEYRACARSAAEAAWMVSFYGPGGEVRFGHHTSMVLWHEGREIISGKDDTKKAANIIDKRLDTYNRERAIRDRKRINGALKKVANSMNKETSL